MSISDNHRGTFPELYSPTFFNTVISCRGENRDQNYVLTNYFFFKEPGGERDFNNQRRSGGEGEGSGSWM